MIQSNIYKSKTNVSQIFKLSVLLITIFALDFIIGNLLNIFYFKQKFGMQYRTTYSIEKTTADLLVFGSSTASHDYHPEIFQNRLNTSYYNIGSEGNSIFYHYAVLKAVLKRYTPKIIIYDFDVNEFSNDPLNYERLSSLLPYYKKHAEMRSMIELKSSYEKFKLVSNIYPYNSLIFKIAAGNIDYGSQRRKDIDFNINGYIPFTKVWNEPIKESSTHVNYGWDSNKIKFYESFIKDCVDSGAEVYVVCAPIFINHHDTSYSVALGRGIAGKYNVRFLDYSRDSTMLCNPRFFADVLHLNDDGAKFYSNKVADTILAEYSKRSLEISK